MRLYTTYHLQSVEGFSFLMTPLDRGASKLCFARGWVYDLSGTSGLIECDVRIEGWYIKELGVWRAGRRDWIVKRFGQQAQGRKGNGRFGLEGLGC